MQKYQVKVNGQNLLMDFDGTRAKHGFYTQVYVEAFTSADAELRAIDLLQEDAHLAEKILNAADDPMTLAVDEVREIESFDGRKVPRCGLIFYPEEEEE